MKKTRLLNKVIENLTGELNLRHHKIINDTIIDYYNTQITNAFNNISNRLNDLKIDYIISSDYDDDNNFIYYINLFEINLNIIIKKSEKISFIENNNININIDVYNEFNYKADVYKKTRVAISSIYKYLSTHTSKDIKELRKLSFDDIVMLCNKKNANL